MSAKLHIRGMFTNGVPLGLLYLLATKLDLELYVYIALACQYLVFILHGLPCNSEKFYDLSGSMTHFAVVAASMICTSPEKSPR